MTTGVLMYNLVMVFEMTLNLCEFLRCMSSISIANVFYCYDLDRGQTDLVDACSVKF